MRITQQNILFAILLPFLSPVALGFPSAAIVVEVEVDDSKALEELLGGLQETTWKDWDAMIGAGP